MIAAKAKEAKAVHELTSKSPAFLIAIHSAIERLVNDNIVVEEEVVDMEHGKAANSHDPILEML